MRPAASRVLEAFDTAAFDGGVGRSFEGALGVTLSCGRRSERLGLRVACVSALRHSEQFGDAVGELRDLLDQLEISRKNVRDPLK